MDFIDPAHEKQVLLIDGRRAWLSVNAGPIDAEKFCLAFDGKPGMAGFQKGSTFAGA
jgi:hypothetical protein